MEMHKNGFRYEEVLSKLFGAKSGLTVYHKIIIILITLLIFIK